MASVFADRQCVVLELGIFAKAHGFIGLLRHRVITAGGHAQTHGIGFLGHFFRGAHQVVGHQLAAGVLEVDVGTLRVPRDRERPGEDRNDHDRRQHNAPVRRQTTGPDGLLDQEVRRRREREPGCGEARLQGGVMRAEREAAIAGRRQV